MGYGYDDDADSRAHRTGRIIVLALLVFAMCAFTFAYKVGSCETKPETSFCKDAFYEIKNTDAPVTHTCSPGATVEIVNSPPSPKPGILCRCNGQVTAPSATPNK